MQWTKIRQPEQVLSKWHLCHSLVSDALTMSKQLMEQESLCLCTKGTTTIITVHLNLQG